MGEKDNKKGSDGKKEEGAITVLLKLDMHCEGCVKKIRRAAKHFNGVQSVNCDQTTNKLSVIGSKIDPAKLRETLEFKIKKKVELISPAPAKSKDDGTKKTEGQKPKEPSVSTVVLKIQLHCDGCIEKIRKAIKKTKGVQEVNIDSSKDLVTVKGTMDAKTLPATLEGKFKRNITVVPPPPKKDGGGDAKKEGDGGKTDGGKLKDQAKLETNKMISGYYPIQTYTTLFDHHTPQVFSDENPNFCSVM